MMMMMMKIIPLFMATLLSLSILLPYTQLLGEAYSI